MNKCRDCKYCYNNDTMEDLYICVNLKSKNFSFFTNPCCDDYCENCVETEDIPHTD